MPFKAVLVCKFVIIDKWKICCVREDGQDFGNFEESLCQGMLFDIKKLNLLLKGCICTIVLEIHFFFYNLTCWRYEGFKK